MKAVIRTRSIRMVIAPTWLLLAALAVLISSCGDGVTQVELDAEIAKVASLKAKVDDTEAEMALVQSRLAQQAAEAAGLRKSIDQAEAREALLAAFLAWNRRSRPVKWCKSASSC